MVQPSIPQAESNIFSCQWSFCPPCSGQHTFVRPRPSIFFRRPLFRTRIDERQDSEKDPIQPLHFGRCRSIRAASLPNGFFDV
jgi:hypothetical protein